MKLDMDLVRKILLQAEAAPPNQEPEINLPECDEATVLEYLELLNEKGLIDARIEYSSMGGGRILVAYVKRLTWEGHEFLANAKNEKVWAKTKELVLSKGGSVSFEIFKTLLVEAAKALFIPTH